MAIWTVFFSTVLVPLATILMLWLRPSRPRNAWVATLIMTTGVVAFSLLAAPWGWFGIPLRAGLLLLFIAAVIISLRRPVVDEPKDESPLRMVVKGLIAVLFGGVAIGVIRAHQVPDGAIDLGFPLRNGSFLVMHGGSHGAANVHAAEPERSQDARVNELRFKQFQEERYAVDLVQISDVGMRARGLYPDEPDRYVIWGAEVLSPCAGTVLQTVDGLPDLQPGGARDEENPHGNHVVIRCGDIDVTLAHLQKGSIRVQKGTTLASLAPVAKVGNSGNTTEPHLHVHAARGGVAVPARFDGNWLVRNRMVRR